MTRVRVLPIIGLWRRLCSIPCFDKPLCLLSLSRALSLAFARACLLSLALFRSRPTFADAAASVASEKSYDPDKSEASGDSFDAEDMSADGSQDEAGAEASFWR